MATTGVVNGNDLLVYVDGTKLYYSTTCSLEMTGAGTINYTSKDTTNWAPKLKAKGHEWTVSCDAMMALDATYGSPNDLFTLMDANTTVSLKFTTNTSGDEYFTGSAVVTAVSLNAGLNEAATLSVTFEGLGDLDNPSLT